MLMDIVSFVSGLVLMLFGICIVLWILYEVKMSPVDRELRKKTKASFKLKNTRKTTKRQQNKYLAKLIYFFTFKRSCYSCYKDIDHRGPRKCPVCKVEFEGGGWKGFKKYWIDEHENNQSYDNLMKHMCLDHKNKEKPKS